MRRINTGYRLEPILRAAILEKIKKDGLTIAQNDDPIDWFKRTFCLKPKPKQRSFVYQGRQHHQVQRIPILAGQIS